MSSKPIVRNIAADDLEQAIALDSRITGQSRRGFYRKRFAAMQDSPKSFLWLVAIVDDRLAGFVSAHLLEGEYGGIAPSAVIDAVGVLPELRGQGIAHALMEALEIQLKARHMVEIDTEVGWNQHELVQFFAASGFQLAPSLVLEGAIFTDF